MENCIQLVCRYIKENEKTIDKFFDENVWGNEFSPQIFTQDRTKTVEISCD